MLDFLINILETPAIVLGLVALIGLLLQGKSAAQVFSGTVKTALGMLVLGAGAGLIVGEILPFVDLFSLVFNLQVFAALSLLRDGILYLILWCLVENCRRFQRFERLHGL